MIYRFRIDLPPITKKNSQQIVLVHGRPIIIPSKAYKAYENDAGFFLKGRGARIDYPVQVTCIYHMPTRRKVDLTNLLEATHDVLVKYEVLADDNSNIIKSVDGSRAVYDKEDPHTEVIITEYKEEV